MEQMVYIHSRALWKQQGQGFNRGEVLHLSLNICGRELVTWRKKNLSSKQLDDRYPPKICSARFVSCRQFPTEISFVNYHVGRCLACVPHETCDVQTHPILRRSPQHPI
eukprot:scaffold7696_cov141-Cylindrotheca_fusiformis.AAC.12